LFQVHQGGGLHQLLDGIVIAIERHWAAWPGK
jgi:hypothetical protein